jgi:hypothetical protein
MFWLAIQSAAHSYLDSSTGGASDNRMLLVLQQINNSEGYKGKNLMEMV